MGKKNEPSRGPSKHGGHGGQRPRKGGGFSHQPSKGGKSGGNKGKK